MLDVSIVVTAPLLLLLQTAGEPPIRRAVLTNDTRRLIVEIYVSDDGANNWKEDQTSWAQSIYPPAVPYSSISMIETAIAGLM